VGKLKEDFATQIPINTHPISLHKAQAQITSNYGKLSVKPFLNSRHGLDFGVKFTVLLSIGLCLWMIGNFHIDCGYYWLGFHQKFPKF